MRMIRQYLNSHPRLRLPILIAFIVVIGLFAWSIYYKAAVFHVQSVTPDASDFPATTRIITITFNKPLSPQNSTSNLALDPKLSYNFSIQDNKLIVQLAKPLAVGDSLRLSLLNIAALNGDTITQDVNFTVKYVEFDKLDKAEQERQIEDSDSFENSYTLVDELPIETLEYSVSNDFPDAGDPRMPIIISMNFNIRTSSDSGAPSQADVDEYTALVRQYRTEAINKVKSLKGYDPALYRFEFSENLLLSEFGGTLSGQ